MTKIYVPQGHPTITTRFSVAELAGAGVELTDGPAVADVVVAAMLEELTPPMQRFLATKKYLIWCDEPLWSNIFQRIDGHWAQFSITGAEGPVSVRVDAMNCFTGNVLFNNHHFLLDIYQLDMASLVRTATLAQKPLAPPGERKVAAFQTYRNGGFWDFQHPSGIHGLNTLRSRIALEGGLFGRVDVYGQGWPFDLAKPENSEISSSEDPFVKKLAQYKNYNFALCLENTWSPYYVTEKLWQAIIANCLPIYFAGPTHSVYQDFPKNSFIDYADFDHPAQLFAMIDGLSQEEFDRRLGICRHILFNAIRLSRDGQGPRQLQLAMFADRVHNLASFT